ncbi:MAG: ABC transporter permease, partial [Gemmatimonadota bacterium]|nr:ABC transporter permease [Gemmatimonadota bacterium]
MRTWRRWAKRIKGLLAPGAQDAQAMDEMAFHIEMETREGIARGLSPEEAKRIAMRDFGGVERYREQVRETRWGHGIQQLARDTRLALRSLWARPGYTAAVLATLGLGIGATTAFFSLVHGVLLRPLPYPDPDQLIRIGAVWEGTPEGALSPAEFVDLESSLSDLPGMGAYAFGSLTFTGEGRAERARTAFISAGAWQALAIEPVLGRVFTPEEDARAADVIVLTDGFWRARFGADPDIVGRTVQVSGVAAVVLGVLPPEFRVPEDLVSPEPVQVVSPLGIDPSTVDLGQRGNHFLLGVARLAPEMSLSDAIGRVRDAGMRMVEVHPDQYPPEMRFRTAATPLLRHLVGQARPTLLLLMGAVALAFTIVWANVANLQLARLASRSGEIALRRALGAGRGRIVSQVLVESLVLALGGGILGVLIAMGATGLLVGAVPGNLPRVEDIGVSGPVLAFGLGTALCSGLLFGVIPAWYAGRGPLPARIGSGDRNTADGNRARLRGWLVISQVAVAVVLAASSILVARSLRALADVDPGFSTDNVVAARFGLPSSRYPADAEVTDFFASFVDELASLPGVEHAGAVTNLPLATGIGDMSFELEEERIPEGRDKPDADWQVVTPGYFETLRLRLVSGRSIADRDRADGPGVVVVNRTMAELHWPNQDPLGRRIRLGGEDTEPRWAEVIGVVDDVRHTSLDAPSRPQMYLAHQQFRGWSGGAPLRTLTVVVHTTLPPGDLARSIRERLSARDPELALYGLMTLDEARDRSLARQRFTGGILTAFTT